METIELRLTSQGWIAQFSNPDIKRLFGTDTIPTPYTPRASVDLVLAEIQKRNPNCIVTVERRTI